MAREAKTERARSARVPRRRRGKAEGSRAPHARASRAPAARHFQPGDLRADGAGTVLRCLVLVAGPDWVAVDLDSGVLMRAPAHVASVGSAESLEPEEPEEPELPPRWPDRTLTAVEMTLGVDPNPPDPGRPEAVLLSGRPRSIGDPRRRTTRRLLRRLVSKTGDRPLLGTLGPSIAYGDLDGTRPSVVVIAPEVRPRFGTGPTGPWCQFLLGGRRHTLPCAEGAAPDANATGHGAKLLVVALGAPQRGQVPKVVLGALPLAR